MSENKSTNILQAIYIISTGEILYSRAIHDCMVSLDGRVHIDGGRDYTKIGGMIEDTVLLEIDKDYLLDHILHADYNFHNKNAKKFPQGYHGRFVINSGSNDKFYRRLVVNYEDIEGYVEERLNEKARNLSS